MFRNWRAWILFILFAGPIAAYVAFGSIWLWEHGWIIHASLIWMGLYVLFTLLADRWTKTTRAMLPPLDWTAPRTFAPRDREAWAIVEEEAAVADESSLDDLTKFDLLSATGQRLARRLAAHYYPRSSDPVEEVPVVELLTALELAAEDLRSLCQEVPGGDLITPGHFKQAVQAANFLQRANEVYTYLLPVFSPFTGLARLGTQKLIATPAWRNAQRTALQWFFRAYVNRLGTHLIELYSGRLAIGADAYRALTGKNKPRSSHTAPKGPVAVVAGAKRTGKSVLIAGMEKELGGDLSPSLRARLSSVPGGDPTLPARLARLGYAEVDGFPGPGDCRESKARRAREEAAEEAAEGGDALVLLVDASRGDPAPELEFLDRWRAWFEDKPSLDPPPALIVATGIGRMAVDEPAAAGEGALGVVTASTAGVALREKAAAAWVAALEARLPSSPARPAVVVLDLDDVSPARIAEALAPALAGRFAEIERAALLRHFHRTSMRSKARRVFEQAGRQGARLWTHLRSRKDQGEGG